MVTWCDYATNPDFDLEDSYKRLDFLMRRKQDMKLNMKDLNNIFVVDIN